MGLRGRHKGVPSADARLACSGQRHFLLLYEVSEHLLYGHEHDKQL